MQRGDAVGEAAEEMLEQVCGRGAVDEDDGWFGEVSLGEQQHVQVFFLVHDVD